MLLGAGAFFFGLMLGGTAFVAMLAVVGVWALLGVGHYLVWGRDEERASRGGDRGIR